MKKIVTLFLSFTFLISLVLTVSCSSQDEEVFDMDFRRDYEIDLTGQVYRWGSHWSEQILFESGFSEGGDMILKRLSDLTEKYGCTFEIIKWENGTGRIFQEAAAGYNTINFIDSDIKTSGLPLYKANMLYALNDIPNIDMSDNKFGSPRFLQDAILDDKFYGFFPYAWEIIPEYTGVIHFNDEMLSSFGLNNPHELRENGMWDWANFKEYLLSIQEAAANADYDDNFVPIICGASYDRDALGFMFANGLQMIEGSNGNYTFGLDNSNGMAAVEFLADLYKEGLYEQRGAADFVKNKMSALMTNHSYFSTHYYAGGASDEYLPAQDYVYGMIRYPHGPNGNENSVSSYVNKHRKNFVLNTSGHDIEDIGTVMNYVFAPLDNNQGWSGLLKDQTFYHEEDYNEYVYMMENINYTYNVFLEKGFDTLLSGFSSAVTGNKSISEVFTSTRSAIQEAIDKNVTWTYDELVSK